MLHKKSNKYSDEQRQAAIQYYIDHGLSKARTIRILGYPFRQQLKEWIRQRVNIIVFIFARHDHPCRILRWNMHPHQDSQ